MVRTIRLIATGVFAVVFATCAAAHEPEAHEKADTPIALVVAPEKPDSPVALVRALQDVQARLAAGDRDAYAEQPRMMAKLGEDFAKAPPETWEDRKNARALIAYLVSGGQPQLMRQILDAKHFAKEEESLAKGALAYMEGREKEAKRWLADIDPRDLDLSLGGHIAFVQSMLFPPAEKDKAIERLDLARLLMPGSLVEEAALRREVSLIGGSRDLAKYGALSRQYMDRFRYSPYADNFFKQFSQAVARFSLTIDVAEFANLDELTQNLTPDARRDVYLTMARASVMAGRSAVGALAAEKAMTLSQDGSVDLARAKLYRGAALVASERYGNQTHLLDSSEKAKLTRADAELCEAVELVARDIRDVNDDPFDTPPPPAPANGKAAEADEAIKIAENALESANESLKKASP